MPRALSDQERAHQRQHLLTKGRELIFTHGIRKLSIDDVVHAAGVAKGTFYLYFDSKEAFLNALVHEFMKAYFGRAAQMIASCPREALPERLRDFLRELFELPESIFFFKNHNDLERLLQAATDDDIHSIHDLETRSFTHLLELAGIDTRRVRPGVVHNLLHAMYSMLGEELMMREEVPETFDVMLDCLLRYLFQEV